MRSETRQPSAQEGTEILEAFTQFPAPSALLNNAGALVRVNAALLARFRLALESLLTHVARHFADEEVVLAEHGYADLEQHKRAHEGLLRRAGYLKVRVESGHADLGSVVELFAQDVVARHLLTVDRAIFPHFAGRTAATGQPVPR